MVNGFIETKRAIGIIRKFIEEYAPKFPITIGISGGADSVALAIILSKVVGKNNLKLLMVDHLTMSKKTLNHIKEKIDNLKISDYPLEIQKVENRAKKNDESELRSLRFEVFKNATSEIFLAQTKNDQAEQVLLGLLRGSGTRSLSGMSETQAFVNKLIVFRPLILNLTRKQTETICIENNYDFYIDKMESKRGNIRHDLIPTLKKYNPKVIDNLVNTSKILCEQQTFINNQTEKLFNQETLEKKDRKISLNIEKLLKVDIALRKNLYIQILRQITNFDDLDFSNKHIEQIDELVINYNGQKELNLPNIVVNRIKNILTIKNI